ncbi:UNVERIFIED_CONTAM: hypothetical protein HDU68_007808 [Siphonaria sp. JEL0065]|nr:hypothetical protein HDU68_007808 [Siphonaria sp. JEL0065]
MCTPQPRTKFLPTYLHRFYSAISIALRTGHPQTLTSIIMNCGNLFLMDLEASRVLVYDFAIGLKRILPATEKTGFPVSIVPMEELRKGCLRIIGGILGVLNQFGTVGIKTFVALERSEFTEKIRACYPQHGHQQQRSARPSNESKVQEDLTQETTVPPPQPTPTFKTLKPYFLDLLLNTLHLEQSPTNTKQILHILSCFSIEEIDYCPEAVSLVLFAVKDKILGKCWSQDVQACAFDLLAQLCFFWEALDKSVKGTCKEIVGSLCGYIDGLFAEDNVVVNQQSIIKGYDCLMRWALIGGWMEREKECIARVNATLCRGVSILAQDDEFSVITGGSGGNTTANQPIPSKSGSNTGSNGNLLGISGGNSYGTSSPSPLSPNFSTLGGASSAQSSSTSTGPPTGVGLGNTTTGEKSTLANHFAAFAGNMSTMTTDTLRKHRVKQKRSATLLNPLTTLVAAVTNNNTQQPPQNNSTPTLLTLANPIPSTTLSNQSQPPQQPSTTAATGVSTFAKLTADSAVKSAAEIALSQLLNHLGNFPPQKASFGSTRISTLFQERDEVKRILGIRERLLQNSIFASSRNSVGSEGLVVDEDEGSSVCGSSKCSSRAKKQQRSCGGSNQHVEGGALDISNYKKYIRYYVYDNRILMGLLEQPEWAREPGRSIDDDDGPDEVDSEVDYTLQPPRDPKLILILRDATGKFSWVSRLKYVEDSKRAEVYQQMQLQQFGIQSLRESSVKQGTTVEPLASGDDCVGNGLSMPAPSRQLRPKSAPMLGGARKPTPVKLKEQLLIPHESEGNIVEAFQSERKSQTQIASAAASARTSAVALLESTAAIPPSGEYHVRPKLPPYIPPNSEVLKGECFNEGAMPKFTELLNPESEEGRRFELLKKKLDKCIEIENATYSGADDDRLVVDIAVRPTPPIDRFDVNVPCVLFRQFLSHMGYLTLEAREKLKPMNMSETFLKDLEKMDSLPE